MSRTATTPRPTASNSPATSPDEAQVRPREGHRETVEALVVAFILALLVRGFAAEAFVIPTGSMAPTLMGRHKEVTCPECGHVYSVNASEEVEGVANDRLSERRVHTGICVNCRFQTRIDRDPSFKGDRILVMKFPYDLPFLPGASPPNRWDVVVFRYPEEPETSYIKRLVGLPGEELRVWFGDLSIKPPGGDAFRLEHKPLEHQRAMQMLVYDDTHRARRLGTPEWRRWSAGDPSAWREESEDVAGSRSYQYVSAASPGWSELRYRHLVPDPDQWNAILEERKLPRSPRSTLITDFYSYNTNLTESSSDLNGSPHYDQKNAWLQPHWVGDLTLSANLRFDAPGGSVRFELIEGGIANRCEIDLTSGLATLSHGAKGLRQGASGITGPGTYGVEFANVDGRLTVWVDGRPIFGDGAVYEDGSGPHAIPTQADLSPAAVATRGAAATVSDLVLKRDIYYTQKPGITDYETERPVDSNDETVWGSRKPNTPVELFDFLSDPAQFEAMGKLTPSEYPIGPDRYMMMGDNSPRSKDGRGWDNKDRLDPDYPDQGWDSTLRESWEVPRALITGKAFFVYWPHGKPFGPDIRLSTDFRLPFRPYVERMKWIR